MLTILGIEDSSELDLDLARARLRVRVLVVDDDAAVLSMVAKSLVAAGFAVATAHGGNDALVAIREQPEAIDLLLTDVVMPEMDGAALACKVREIVPNLPILLMSGFADIATRHGPLIAKPFKPAALIAMIDSLLSLERRAPGREEPEDKPGATRSA
ncbi:MAG TPA: response regulator [Bryobacteraceae bacterium]|nr:response regulator [Bryobacteraceae bacterium]